jgi:hypothetical protein
MTEQSIFAMIGSLGFPIAVSVYLLVYFRKAQESLKDVINSQTIVMTQLKDVITRLCDEHKDVK